MLKDALIDKYKKYFPNSNEKNCLKIHYKYGNKLSVNLFFDSYDKDCFGFYMSLICSTDYYFTPLNIDYLDTNRKWFLDKLPKLMLWNILAGKNNLDSFCNDIKERIKNYIENEEILKCSYDDNDFKKAIQFTEKNQAQKPFLSHIRKMQDKKMGESHFKMLQNNFDIPLKILQKLQNSNRTIVTTSDPSKRKKLTIILQVCYEN